MNDTTNSIASDSSAMRIARKYIDAWNETDPVRRKALLEAGWTPAARYIDPMMQGEGHEQIQGLMAAVQDRFPGWRFALLGNADQHGDHLRFSWMLGPHGSDGPVKGTDFATLQDGRLSQVIGFLDQVPQEA